MFLAHLNPPNSLVALGPRRPARRQTTSTQVSSGVRVVSSSDLYGFGRRSISLGGVADLAPVLGCAVSGSAVVSWELRCAGARGIGFGRRRRFRQQTVVRERQFLAAEPVHPVDGDRQQTVGEDLDPSATSRRYQSGNSRCLRGVPSMFSRCTGPTPPLVRATSPRYVEQREDAMKDAAVVLMAVHRGTLFKDLPLQALRGVVFDVVRGTSLRTGQDVVGASDLREAVNVP